MDRIQLLADLLVGHLPAQPVAEEAEWLELVALAQAEGVGPLLARALDRLEGVVVPEAVGRTLARLYRYATFASLRHQAVRESLCRGLAERKVPALLLKGAALAVTCYEDPATRPMVDIDLLVPRAHRDQAVCCLRELGFAAPSGLPNNGLRSPRGHLVAAHAATHALVELHWELKLLGRAERNATAEIWTGAQPAAPNETALVMRLAHTLPLLCTHMLLQHQESRLLWLYDIHRVLLAMDDREAMLARDAATRWRLGPCTALALLRVRELFGTPLPAELASWAESRATGHGLQRRVAAQALAEPSEAPSEYLVSLLMNRTFSPLRILFPTPDDLRLRLGLRADEPVGPSAYLTFATRRLRNSPLHLSHLWRLWRTPSPPQLAAPPPGINPSSRQNPD